MVKAYRIGSRKTTHASYKAEHNNRKKRKIKNDKDYKTLLAYPVNRFKFAGVMRETRVGATSALAEAGPRAFFNIYF